MMMIKDKKLHDVAVCIYESIIEKVDLKIKESKLSLELNKLVKENSRNDLTVENIKKTFDNQLKTAQHTLEQLNKHNAMINKSIELFESEIVKAKELKKKLKNEKANKQRNTKDIK